MGQLHKYVRISIIYLFISTFDFRFLAMSIVLSDSRGTSTYAFHPLISDLGAILDAGTGEHILCMATYDANLYIGTSSGRILHYHRFETSYTLISRLVLSNGEPINKMLVLPDIERILILVGSILTVHTLPELSRCHIGRMKDIKDVSILAVTKKNLASVPPTRNKIITFTSSVIRIVQINEDSVKLLKEINYANAVKGLSTSTTNPQSNYSNLVLVGNDTNYDIIDLKLNRKIPLFEYNSGSSVDPYILAYTAEDNDREEYLLSISADPNTSLSMVVNSLGDATRGTLTWMGQGYPSGGLVVSWPYVVGIFNGSDVTNRFVVSSLESMSDVESVNLAEVLGKKLSETTDLDEHNEGLKDHKSEENEQDHKNEENHEQDQTNEENKEDHKNEENHEENKNNEPDNNQESGQNELLELKESQLNLVELSEVKEETNDLEKKDTLKDKDSDNEHSKMASKETFDKSKGHSVTSPTSLSVASQGLVPRFKIVEVDKVTYTYSLGSLLDRVMTTGEENLSKDSIEIQTKVLVHDENNVWVFLKEDENVRALDALEDEPSEAQIKTLEKLLGSSSGEIHEYLLNRLVIALFSTKKYDDSMQYLTRFKNGHLIANPVFMVTLLLGQKMPGIAVFKGIQRILSTLSIEPNKAFCKKYLDAIFGDIITPENDIYNTLRLVYYKDLLSTTREIAEFLGGKDSSNWLQLTPTNEKILEGFEKHDSRLPLLSAYSMLVKGVPSMNEKLCMLGVQVLKEEQEEIDAIGFTKKTLLDEVLSHFPKLDKQIYSKLFLEVFDVDHEQAFNFLKKDSTKEFKDINKKIMEQVSRSYQSEASFALLKVEYLEHSLAEDGGDYQELLDELVQVLTNSTNFKEEDVVNFTILESTYKIENSLQDSSWPKISWINYLRFRLLRLTEKDFTRVYLKVFELVVKLEYSGEHISTLLKTPHLLYFSVFSETISKSDKIRFLLEYGDFSSAEYFALYETLPLPKDTFYGESNTHPRIVGNAKQGLLEIFDYYTNEDREEVEKLNSITHFMHTYGNGNVLFDAEELINLVPDSVPLVYLVDFLTKIIVNLNTNGKSKMVHKCISKANASATRRIYEDMTENEK